MKIVVNTVFFFFVFIKSNGEVFVNSIFAMLLFLNINQDSSTRFLCYFFKFMYLRFVLCFHLKIYTHVCYILCFNTYGHISSLPLSLVYKITLRLAPENQQHQNLHHQNQHLKKGRAQNTKQVES
jgi:hypothetical protein